MLRGCLERKRLSAGRRDVLFAAQDPRGDLPFAAWDTKDAAAYFPVRHVLAEDQATLAGVRRLIGTAHEVLLACHGDVGPEQARCEIAWNGPRPDYEKAAGIGEDRNFVGRVRDRGSWG